MPEVRARGGPLAFILATVFINMLGVGLAWPILPKLIEEMAGGGISDAAFFYGLIATVYALAQFLFAPLLGSLSDAYGRRPIMLASQAGLAIDYTIAALAPNLWWLAGARLVAGMLGATISTANAYVADISTPDQRSRNFGYIGAAFGFGFIAGPLIGGVLGGIDLRLPFILASVMCLLNAVFGFLALPESLPADRRRRLAIADSSPVRVLRRVGRFPVLHPLIAALALTAIAGRGLEAIWVLYTGHRYGWDVSEAAFSLAFVGLMFIGVQGFLVGPVVRRIGERRTVIGGYAVGAVSLLALGLAPSGWMAYPVLAGYIAGGALADPALKALCSSAVPATEQGLLQGILNSFNAVAVIIGPLAASLLFSASAAESSLLGQLPGAWFLLGSLFFLAAALAARRTAVGEGRNH